MSGYTWIVFWKGKSKVTGLEVHNSFPTTEDMVKRHLSKLLKRPGVWGIGCRKIGE
jgi:hypothetical protein